MKFFTMQFCLVYRQECLYGYVDGVYPIVSGFYAVYRKNNGDPNIRKLISRILSEEEQRTVYESGHIQAG